MRVEGWGLRVEGWGLRVEGFTVGFGVWVWGFGAEGSTQRGFRFKLWNSDSDFGV